MISSKMFESFKRQFERLVQQHDNLEEISSLSIGLKNRKLNEYNLSNLKEISSLSNTLNNGQMDDHRLWRLTIKHTAFGKVFDLDFREQQFKSIDFEENKYKTHYFAGLKDDLKTRDFTINGLFYDLQEMKIVDFHSGIQDIRLRKLKMINDYENTFVVGIWLEFLRNRSMQVPKDAAFHCAF